MIVIIMGIIHLRLPIVAMTSKPEIPAAQAGIFRPSPHIKGQLKTIGGKFPILVFDDFYAEPERVREAALAQHYAPSQEKYPGRHAELPCSKEERTTLETLVLDIVNRHYLPKLKLQRAGKIVPRLPKVVTDFSIVDTAPDELTPIQRQPHLDPAPIFGLVYLNVEERGGTLFFEREGNTMPPPAPRGYMADSAPGWRVIGKTEGKFNQLAIYPGQLPHSGEIRGEWITEARSMADLRLTQRFIFFE